MSLLIADEMLLVANWTASLLIREQRPKTPAYLMAEDPFADPPAILLAETEPAEACVRTVHRDLLEEVVLLKEARPIRRPRAAPTSSCSATDVLDVEFMQAFEQQHYTPRCSSCGGWTRTRSTPAVGVSNADGTMVPNGYLQTRNPTSL